ncbi:hypothetical protein [Kitasatospora sp. NPDC088783]|uniref:hypothetical protein n=1 Tax=Kitasatospora sp. NPDC088783 TaxID=3364077 RepID=UPI0038056003
MAVDLAELAPIPMKLVLVYGPVMRAGNFGVFGRVVTLEQEDTARLAAGETVRTVLSRSGLFRELTVVML